MLTVYAMKSAEQILGDARKSSQEYNGQEAVKDGNYNTGYMLSHEQIQAVALVRISEKQNISLQEAAEKYYIDGISASGIDFSQVDNSAMEAFFGETVDNATAAASASGKPSFFSVDADNHFVMVALVPSRDAPPKLSVLYLNSMLEPITTFGDIEKEFAARRQDMVKRGGDIELLEAEFVNANETLAKERQFAEVGKGFAGAVISYLKYKRVELATDEVVDKSQDQQFSECCGLSVASNIADVSLHVASRQSLDEVNHSLFTPKNAQEKESYYKAFGSKLFTEEALLGKPSTKEHSLKAKSSDLVETLGDDKRHNAEIILKVALSMRTGKEFEALSALYDEKVRGVAGPQPPQLPQFDKIVKGISPREFGRLLSTSSSKLPITIMSNESFNKLQEAVQALHSNKQSPGLAEDKVAGSLLQNLSLEQMTYVLKSIDAYNDFEQKGWLSKAIIRLTEGVQNLFRGNKIDNQTTGEGLLEFLTEGAGLKTESLNAGKQQRLENNQAPVLETAEEIGKGVKEQQKKNPNAVSQLPSKKQAQGYGYHK